MEIVCIMGKKITGDKGREPGAARKMGFTGLTALVFGMMVGAGIFNLPQNMAAYAGPKAVICAWLITAVGMLTLVFTFKILSERRPDLNEGLYLYAQEGFGRFTGYMTAWGYWLCTAFANVAYAVMLNDSLAAFFPQMMNHGLPLLIFGSLLIWGIYYIVKMGMKTAVLLTTAMSLLKVGCIVMIIILLIVNVKEELFVKAFEGITTSETASGSFGDQVKNTMLVTLWCFIGIEGAVMMSGRAKRSKDVGRAGVAGFLAAWILYVLVSVLSYGLMTRARLAGLDNPSVAYVLRETCGEWAYWIVIISVILSLTGGWLAWSLVCAEVPYTAAKQGLFPKWFLGLNKYQIPTAGLFVSSVLMQLFLLVLLFSNQAYLTALNVTGMMILPAYLFAALFLWKISRKGYPKALIVAVACTIFCVWMLYAGGLMLLLETSIFYVIGLSFYFEVKRERGDMRLNREERIGISLLTICAVISFIVLFW